MAGKSDKSPGKASDAKEAPKATGLKAAARKATTSRRKAPVITDEMIAERAYFIAESGTGSSDHENWIRAEAELRAGT